MVSRHSGYITIVFLAENIFHPSSASLSLLHLGQVSGDLKLYCLSYVQGMNYVAAVLLLNMGASEVIYLQVEDLKSIQTMTCFIGHTIRSKFSL